MRCFGSSHCGVDRSTSTPLQHLPAVKPARPAGDPRDIEAAARVLVQARQPLLHAGQGVLYAEATPELIELADLLQIPVMTTLEGKSAFPEDHPLALGSGSGVMSGPVYHCLGRADVVFAIGTSLTKHGMATTMPPGKVIIHATTDVRDLNKHYQTAYPILGDARLVLCQMIDAVKDLCGPRGEHVTAPWPPRLPRCVRGGCRHGCPGSPPPRCP
jgi:acetolactate synthase-1/2/3 large subunit